MCVKVCAQRRQRQLRINKCLQQETKIYVLFTHVNVIFLHFGMSYYFFIIKTQDPGGYVTPPVDVLVTCAGWIQLQCPRLQA